MAIPLDLNCTETCGDLLLVGEDAPHSDQLIDPFCDTLLEAQSGILPVLQALFAEVEVGDPDTYPSPEKIESVVSKVIELIEHGNEIVPDEIADAWYTATSQIGQLEGARGCRVRPGGRAAGSARAAGRGHRHPSFL